VTTPSGALSQRPGITFRSNHFIRHHRGCRARAGATLAHTLASRGIQVTLIASRSPSSNGTTTSNASSVASGPAPLAVPALRQMGFADVLARLPQLDNGSGGISIWIRGQERVRVDAPPSDPDEDFVLVPQPALLRAIIERAQRSPSFRVERPVLVGVGDAACIGYPHREAA
jgi:2-polyprenyl-6-methoxyphenol hydroxylase-like FAD-dependent oxidoreductase